MVTGSGSEFFSMGILSPVVRAGYTKEQVLELVRMANRVFDALEALPQIVIAALNGVARAGAAELSLACDIRLAASHATWALPEALWGGSPGAGGPVRLPMLVGRARALEIICTGRELSAAELERLGLVLAVHPARSPAGRGPGAGHAHRGQRAPRHPERQAHRQHAPAIRLRRSPGALRRAAHRVRMEPRRRRGGRAHREGRPPRFTGR